MAVKGEVIFYDDGGKEMEGPRDNKSSTIFSFSQKCTMPMQKGSSIPSGSRTYEQFEVVKSIDKITPLIWKALCEGQMLQKVEVILYEIALMRGLLQLLIICPPPSRKEVMNLDISSR
jgi:type VI secretion system Hcp family effector